MLTVAEALAAVIQTVQPGPAVEVALEEASGLVLAQDVVSDIDSPPFDKALMDGYALRLADANAGAELDVIEEVTAGNIGSREVGRGQATRIMTGAPLPGGADLVIPIEETEVRPTAAGEAIGRVRLKGSGPWPAGQFVLRQGAAVRRGVQVLGRGRRLRPQEIAALAELGYARISVVRPPRVAILATGDELVAASERPGPGQIRNSNEPMLASQVERWGAAAVRLGVARDERAALRERIDLGLQCDFLLLSGGVSAGKLDLVPSELAAAGVRQVFHKIQMKPGKPLWFGILPRVGGPPCCVFGLPGNPVSSMVCCELFVRAALRCWSGVQPAVKESRKIPILAALRASNHRPTYHPARIEWTAEGPRVSLVDWIGSSDLCATVDANCTVLLPAGDVVWEAGNVVDVFPWDE